MKNLKITNAIVIALPIVLMLIGLVNNDFLFFAAISTMITGLTQLIIGVKYWVKQPESKFIKIYFLLVAIFFITVSLGLNKEMYTLIIATPILLSIYLTIILYLPVKKE